MIPNGLKSAGLVAADKGVRAVLCRIVKGLEFFCRHVYRVEVCTERTVAVTLYEGSIGTAVPRAVVDLGEVECVLVLCEKLHEGSLVAEVLLPVDLVNLLCGLLEELDDHLTVRAEGFCACGSMQCNCCIFTGIVLYLLCLEGEKGGKPEEAENKADYTYDDADLGHLLGLYKTGRCCNGIRRSGNREQHCNGGADCDEGNHCVGAAKSEEAVMACCSGICHTLGYNDEDRDKKGCGSRVADKVGKEVANQTCNYKHKHNGH